MYVDRGGVDPVPELVLRKGDKFEIEGIERDVINIKFTADANAVGGTGGYGRAINDEGQVLLNLTVSGSLSGLFLITP